MKKLLCVWAVFHTHGGNGVLLKRDPGQVRDTGSCVSVLLLYRSKTKNDPPTPTDQTDNITPSPPEPESETSKMLCVSNASLIMQIQLSSNQVRQAFVLMCVRAGLHDLRKPKLFSRWGKVLEESQMALALHVMENTQI